MASQRDTRINSILHLLAEITNDPGLDSIMLMENPKLVQDSFRKLWRIYKEGITTNILHFKEGTFAKKNRRCNTWATNSSVPDAMNVLCSVCGKETHLFVQIDTSDMFYPTELEDIILHIYTCSEMHEYIVLSAKEAFPPPPKSWTISSFEAVLDKPNTNLDVLVADGKDCTDCAADTPFNIKNIKLDAFPGSKAGGYRSHRYYVQSEEVKYNKAKMFSDMKATILPGQQTLQCECFSLAEAREILQLSSVELPPLEDKSISEIRLFECGECNEYNLFIYTQTLKTGYPSVIFDYEDTYFHILNGGELNGVVISVAKREHKIIAICKLENYEYRPNYKENIRYSSLVSLDKETISLLEDIDIKSANTYSRFKRFISSYEGNTEGKDDEEFTLDVTPNKRLTAALGNKFSIIREEPTLKGCVVEIDDDIVTIYGKLPENYIGDEELLPLTEEQIARANIVGIKIGSLVE